MFKNPTNDEANVEVSRDRERERKLKVEMQLMESTSSCDPAGHTVRPRDDTLT